MKKVTNHHLITAPGSEHARDCPLTLASLDVIGTLFSLKCSISNCSLAIFNHWVSVDKISFKMAQALFDSFNGKPYYTVSLRIGQFLDHTVFKSSECITIRAEIRDDHGKWATPGACSVQTIQMYYNPR